MTTKNSNDDIKLCHLYGKREIDYKDIQCLKAIKVFDRCYESCIFECEKCKARFYVKESSISSYIYDYDIEYSVYYPIGDETDEAVIINKYKNNSKYKTIYVDSTLKIAHFN